MTAVLPKCSRTVLLFKCSHGSFLKSAESHRLDVFVVLDLGKLLRHSVCRHFVGMAVLEDDFVRRDGITH